MNNQKRGNVEEVKKELMKKKVIVYLLYLVTLIILYLGVFFCVYSALKDISFNVLNNQVPGYVFGLLIAYMGLRNFITVSKFKDGFLRSTDKFSWKNFKKEKKISVSKKYN
ncbi:MAG: hypothetical protein WBI07_10535 [Mobilitalea sp.]